MGDQASDHQWVVDPLDGTVNYFYGIPHFCVSIALRFKGEIIVGVIYDPMRDEIWADAKRRRADAERQTISRERARRSGGSGDFGRAFQDRRDDRSRACRCLQEMVHRARKCRLMGSAALDMAYVACGRFDAYIEQGISLWDIAAGWILVENCGRHRRDETADRHEGQIQHHRVERRDRFETLIA